MPDPINPAPAATDQRNSSAVANNIVKGISDRANGKSPAAQPPINGQQPPANPAPVDPNAGKEKYVVEGREVWLSPEQARTYVQKGLAFEPKMDQFARLQQEQAVFVRSLMNDPGKVLSNLAAQNKIPVEQLVQKVLAGNGSPEVKEAVGKWFYEEAVEPLKMTPEQLKAREDAKWRAEHEQKEKSRQDQLIIQENQAKAARAMAELKGFIGEAMKESGLPDNNSPLGAEMARMVADVMRVARFQQKSVTPKQAIEYVKQRVKAVNAAYYEHLNEEDLVKEIGDKNAEKIQKYFLKKAQGAGGQPPLIPKGPRPAARNGERKTINMDEFHDQLAEIKRQG